MPTYEYECTECSHKFELFQSIKDNPIEHCIKCNGKVRRVFGTAAIIFKGSGFYVNDYKNNTASQKQSPSAAGSSTEKKDTQKIEPPKESSTAPVTPD